MEGHFVSDAAWKFRPVAPLIAPCDPGQRRLALRDDCISAAAAAPLAPNAVCARCCASPRAVIEWVDFHLRFSESRPGVHQRAFWRAARVPANVRTGECRGRICLDDARGEIVEHAAVLALRRGRPIDELAVAWNLQCEQLRTGRQRDRLLRVGVHRVLAVFFIPIRDARVVMHVFHDLPPAHAGVVGAE